MRFLNIFLLQLFLCFSVHAEVTVIYKNQVYKYNTINIGATEYVALDGFMESVKTKPVYNRVLHKIVFQHESRSYVLSVLSPSVVVDNKVYLFDQKAMPVVFQRGAVYISTELLDLFSKKIGFELVNNLVIIDPGHGGSDEGAKAILDGKEVLEKNITLEFSKMLYSKLLNLGIKTYLTRRSDELLSLDSRVQAANINHGTMFISIHANASVSNDNAQGFEVFYLSDKASDSHADVVSRAENSVFKKPDGVLKSMLFSGHVIESAKLGSFIESQLIEAGFASRGIKNAPFYVLAGTYMPATLFELGFVSNKDDLKKLVDAEWLQSLATSVASGIKGYLESNRRSINK